MTAGSPGDSLFRKLRTFVACTSSGFPVAQLTRLQNCLRKTPLPLRWVRPENIHLTLKFMGDTPAHAVDKVLATMTQVVMDREPFQLQAGGLGLFPNPRRPRVFWVGLKGDMGSLQKLHTDLERALEAVDPLSFPVEKRPFRSHLTLGRVRGKKQIPPAAVSEALKRCGNFDSESFTVDRIVLYKSDLQPGGAVYTPLGTAELRS